MKALLIRQAATQLAGATFGAGLASIAAAATPHVTPTAFGPAAVTLFGVEIPIFSALFGILGLLLARRIAPASNAGAKLGRVGNAALTALLALGVLALIVTGEKRPIVALGWAVGLGYSGLGFVELVARAVVTGARLTIDAWVSAWAQSKGGPHAK